MNISFQAVTKFYGAVIGINEVTCEIGPGITGLLGSNGAGKSTMLKLASGQLRPSLGAVHIGPDPAWSASAKRNLGFSPDINTFYEEMTGQEFVYLMARLHGFSSSRANGRAAECLAQVGMADRAGRRIGGMSHGMRQRVKLAQALVNDPPVLLLDEPTTGIDPAGRRELGDLMRELARDGRTILVSSHLLSEVEALTNRILVIVRGRIVASGSVGEIREMMADFPFTVRIGCDRPRELACLLFGLPEVQAVDCEAQTLNVRLRNPAKFHAQFGSLVLAHGFQVIQLQTVDRGVDAVFGYLERDSG